MHKTKEIINYGSRDLKKYSGFLFLINDCVVNYSPSPTVFFDLYGLLPSICTILG